MTFLGLPTTRTSQINLSSLFYSSWSLISRVSIGFDRAITCLPEHIIDQEENLPRSDQIHTIRLPPSCWSLVRVSNTQRQLPCHSVTCTELNGRQQASFNHNPLRAYLSVCLLFCLSVCPSEKCFTSSSNPRRFCRGA